VENLVSRLRDDLLKKLLYNPTSFENQKKFIKYLLDLDYLGDPSWDCIANMQHWILQQLLEAKTTHQQPSLPLPSIEYTPDSEMLSTHLSGYGHSRTWSNSSGGSVFAVAKGNAPSNKHSDTDTKTSDSKPKRILFVLKLIDIIQSHLPGLFHLGQAYFNRTLFTNMLNENQDSIISENVAIKPDEFNEMIMELTEVYTDLVNNSLFQDAADHLPPERLSKLGEWKPFDDDLAESSGAWLPLCVRKIRGCLSLLQGLPLPPPPLSLIQQLSLNVCTLSADTLFLRTTRDIEALHMREDWRVQDEEGCVITSLPILFENIVIDVLLTLKEIVIETRPGEVFEDRKPLMLASREHYQGLLEDFCNCLSYLAFGDEKEEGSNSQSITRQETIISLSEDALHMPSVEEQLLLILSNSYYTREHVSPRLYECFINHGYPESPEIQERFREQLEELDRRVFDRYLSYKVDPLCNLVGPGMNGGCFKWNGDALPTGIRDYVHEILLYFVQVHAEVSSISEHLTKKVLSQLLEELSFEMLQQFGSVKSFSNPGKLVGYIEVLAIHETLKSYMTQKTMDNFDAMFELVDSIKKKYARNIRDFTEALTDNTSLQFSCFKIAK
jgi:exocyst complex component 2